MLSDNEFICCDYCDFGSNHYYYVQNQLDNPFLKTFRTDSPNLTIIIIVFHLSTDLSDFTFPSISACPSVASSPVMARRDSILKHSGSVKNTERRVSIMQNQPVVVEYLSEKRPSISFQQQAQSQPSTTQLPHTNSSSNMTQLVSSGRPASLVIAKGERPTIKLIRTPSVDDDDIDSSSNTDQRNHINMSTMNSSGNTTTLTREDEDDDESVPLVQTDSKETTSVSKT